MLDQLVTQEMARWTVPGIVVGTLQDGDVQLQAWGVASLRTQQPMRADMLFRVASISKVFTATLAMTLVDAGLLDLDRPVSSYLPELRLADADALGSITMRHLLSHQSGLLGDYFVSYDMAEDSLERWIGQFHTLRQITRPGEVWSYCNSGFHLAGRVCEKLAGKPFDAAMRERVFQPLGLERTGFFAHEMIVWPHAVGHNQVAPDS
ncbi:MAG: serine hydrolase, partial [Chloroflexi bacterium]